MMNKFHKTSYSRGANFNPINSSHSRRTNNMQLVEWATKGEQPIDRKIQIESSQLLNHKNYQQQSINTNEFANRKNINKSQVKLYETTTGFNNCRERPQSKQQPRAKIPENKMKTEVFLPDRPQTSKGARHFRGKVSQQQQQSQNYEEFPIQVRLTQKNNRSVRSSYSRKGHGLGNQDGKMTKMSFDTSIDPEFLSLFAN